MTPRWQSWLALGGVLSIAAFLRLLWLDAGWLGADQARDLSWAARIALEGDAPDFGPAMRNQLRLGVLYYWFWATAYFFSSALLAPYVFAALIGVVAVGVCWQVGRLLDGPRVGFLAALWLATAPVAVMNARVAWAPAAIPPLVALFLWGAVRLEARPSARALAGLTFLVALGTQLHLSAVVLVPVLFLVFVRTPALQTFRTVGWALLAGLIPLLPMIPANLVPIPFASPTAVADVSPYAGRWIDILLHSGRAVEAFLPPIEGLPWTVRLWTGLEMGSMALVLLAAFVVLVRAVRRSSGGGERVVLETFFAGLLFVLLLPAEAWYYYLDTTLVPGALLVGLAASRARAFLFGGGPVVVWSLVRSAGLIWWVFLAHQTGNLFVQMDLLRLGGGVVGADAVVMQARVPTIATKQQAFAVLGEEFRIPGERIFQDVHGWGFEDLVADNGFFVLAGPGGLPGAQSEAVVIQQGDLPPLWFSGMRAAAAGSLDLLSYRPTLDRSGAAIADCPAGNQLPPPVELHPLRYGSGGRARGIWPCAEMTVVVPITEDSAGRQRRVLARMAGGGRVTSLASVPPGRSLGRDLPAGALGVALPTDARELRLRIVTDGPADLDLLELHGEALGEGPGPW